MSNVSELVASGIDFAHSTALASPMVSLSRKRTASLRSKNSRMMNVWPADWISALSAWKSRHVPDLRKSSAAGRSLTNLCRMAGRDSASFIFLYNNPFRGLTMFMNPGEQPQPGMTMGYDFLVERGNVLVGPPDYVAERLGELQDVGGTSYVLAEMALPYLSQRQVLASMELFATKVMPQLEG